MLKIGLPEQWVHLAMETVQTASYSILINGEANGFITPSRGIKQGEPLSPYLFLLCVEGLSSLIQRAMENQQLRGVLSCNGGSRSHTCYLRMAAYYFVRQQLLNVETCFTYWSLMRKHRVKPLIDKKTTLFFSPNTRQQVKEDIQNMLGAQIMTNCERYLGLPMVGGKSKVSTFRDLQERITKKSDGMEKKKKKSQNQDERY